MARRRPLRTHLLQEHGAVLLKTACGMSAAPMDARESFPAPSRHHTYHGRVPGSAGVGIVVAPGARFAPDRMLAPGGLCGTCLKALGEGAGIG